MILRSFPILILCTLPIGCSDPAPAVFSAKPIAQYQYASKATAGAAEVVAYDKSVKQFYVLNAIDNTIDILRLPAEATVVKSGSLPLETYGHAATSVAAKNGKIASTIAVDSEGTSTQQNGKVLLFDANDLSGEPQQFTVGVHPDMLTFTPDGKTIVVANEGEPNDQYTQDPPGSVSIIELETATVTTLYFNEFENVRSSELPEGFRLTGRNATVTTDAEPEYVAISADGSTAWVSLQENNSLARINLSTQSIEAVLALGTKDHGLDRNSIDVSDKDSGIDLAPRAGIVGMYMPDGIATMNFKDKDYVLTANEGASREYFFNTKNKAACKAAGGLDYDNDNGCLAHIDEIRAKDLGKDYNTLPLSDALTQRADGSDSELGRLRVSTTDGIVNGRISTLHAFGARSFSIFDGQSGALIYDSGDEFTQKLKTLNKNIDYIDSRSDNKGIEPESVVVGTIGEKTIAFIGLERASGVMAYDVTVPDKSKFIDYIEPIDKSSGRGYLTDVSPEGLVFVPAADSPNSHALLVVANEVSGTTSFYELSIK